MYFNINDMLDFKHANSAHEQALCQLNLCFELQLQVKVEKDVSEKKLLLSYAMTLQL